MLNKAVKNLIGTGILDSRRIFTTNKEYSRFLKPRDRNYDMKPTGLWYAIGDSWLEWCMGAEFNGIGNYVYEVELNPKSNILVLDNKEQVFAFAKNKKYANTGPGYEFMEGSFIDWKKVMSEYDGIEINPYFYDLRFDLGLLWYYGWDVPSGCLWKANAKKKINLIAEYSDKKKEFVIL